MGKSETPSGLGATLLALERTEGTVTARVTDQGGAQAQRPHVQVAAAAAAASGGPAARWLAHAFLPAGWPGSVSPDYLSYQVWDSVQGLCSYVRGMLSSQAMLVGVGVGSAAATPLGAVFQFFLRDFSGMLGGIVFASAQGAGFDAYAKQWRLFADCMNNVGLALELASPLLPRAFLAMACLGSVARAMTGVAGGATRHALTQHFALQRNTADIAAKEGSQETAVTLVGMVLGMVLIRTAAGWQPAVWAAFLALTVLHVVANVRAMRCLQMTSVNAARLGLLLRHYLAAGEALTPAQVAARESLVPPPLLRLTRRLRIAGGSSGGDPRVLVAPPLASLSAQLQQQLTAQLRQAPDSRRYLAAVAAPPAAGPVDAAVLLRQGAAASDALEGACLALLLAWNAQLQRGRCPAAAWPPQAQLQLADAHAWMAAGGGGRRSSSGSGGFSEFSAALQAAGWALDRVSLLQGESRLAWGPDLRAE